MKYYRSFDIKARSDSETEEKESYIVEGYASTFDEPYMLGRFDDFEVWEQVDRKAFDSAEMSDVIFQYDHEGRVFARQSNNTLELALDEHGLFVRADLGGTEEGRKLYSDIKGGYINRMSFAFTVSDEEYKEDPKEKKYSITIKKIDRVYDVSAVSIPANPGTEINARLADHFDLETRIKNAQAQRNSCQENLNNSNEQDTSDDEKNTASQERERQAFLISCDLTLNNGEC